MITDYEKQLEEENISLKNLLDERTKELDETKKEMESWRLGTKHNRLPEVGVIEIGGSPYEISSTTLDVKSKISVDGQIFTADDIANLKHLWSLHMQKVNNPPLHYRIWRKIASCLTTKKN